LRRQRGRYSQLFLIRTEKGKLSGKGKKERTPYWVSDRESLKKRRNKEQRGERHCQSKHFSTQKGEKVERKGRWSPGLSPQGTLDFYGDKCQLGVGGNWGVLETYRPYTPAQGEKEDRKKEKRGRKGGKL